MYLSSGRTTQDIVSNYGGDKNSSSGGWSSLIGVITAICGNVLISFALNAQRYAHIRLSRDQHARRKEAGRRPRTGKGKAIYGTSGAIEEQPEEEANTKPDLQDYTLGPPTDVDAHETQPLIPQVDTRRASGKSSSAREGNIEEDEKGDDDGKEKTYLKSPIWWLGISLMVVGEAGNFLAYGFAPASIVSPLGVVALVSNCLIAPLLLGEKFRWRDGLGVLIAIGGCVVVVLSASESNPKLTPDAIWDLVTRWEFETYLGITLFLIVVLAVCSNKFGDRTILIDLGLVGLFGAYTALSTKGVASLLALSIWRVVTYPITYLLLAVLVFTAVMQIKYVNRALQRFNATMVIPTQFVLFTISVIVGSAVLYRDFETERTDDAIKFVAGCALTFFGVWCITSGRGQALEDGDDDGYSDEEDGIRLFDDESGRVGNGKLLTSSSSSIPSMRRTYSTGEIARSLSKSGSLPHGTPSGAVGESNHSHAPNPFISIAPANATAVHMDPSARLTAPSNDPQKPPFHATTSAPVIPTTPSNLASSLRPHTPLARTPSTPNHTSPGKQAALGRSPAGTTPDLNASPQRLLARHSVVGLLPGPLTSPLSGSLAAIVADELRRGTSIRRKRISPSTGIGPPGTAAVATRPKRHSIASGTEADFETEELIADHNPTVPGQAPGGGRMRSLSATLGDIFGSVGRKKGAGLLGPQRPQNGENES